VSKMSEREKFCECYEFVRKDFIDVAKRLLAIAGVFPASVAVDRLRAVEDMDTVLRNRDCISADELFKRRDETAKLLERGKERTLG